jgi:hypothetical protein
VEVPPVDERHIDGSPPEPEGGLKPPEAAPDHDDTVVTAHGLHARIVAREVLEGRDRSTLPALPEIALARSEDPGETLS